MRSGNSLQQLLLVTFVSLILTIPIIVNASTVVLPMDNLPENEGWSKVNDGGSSTISNGILTIESPSYFEYYAPSNWINSVRNNMGWVVETRMKIDPMTAKQPHLDHGSIDLWIHDNTNCNIIGFDTDKIYIAFPPSNHTEYSMDTTNDFHIYRIEGKQSSLKIFVDGALRIGITGDWSGYDCTKGLFFGDQVGSVMGQPTYSKSYWMTFPRIDGHT